MHHLAALIAVTVTLHGHPQEVRVYGNRGGKPVIVSSGDGGWLHLAPHIGEWLSAHGYFVVGFDAKAYLSSCTDGGRTLTTDDVARDYLALIAATTRQGDSPILIGISEGAGLAVRAAADPAVRSRIGGVIALGLGDLNELAWRWRDAVIYFTKGVPHEPTFRAGDFITQVSPAPIALIQSTHDEFVPPEESARLSALARQPKRVWTVPASNHRFSDNLPMLDQAVSDALHWMADRRAH